VRGTSPSAEPRRGSAITQRWRSPRCPTAHRARPQDAPNQVRKAGGSSWVSCSILIISHAWALLMGHSCTHLSHVQLGTWDPPPCPPCWDAAGTSDPQARCHAALPRGSFSSSSNMHHPLFSKKDFLPFFKGKAEIFISPAFCLPRLC